MSSLTLSTNDLRSNSIDAKRDIESKAKWNPKWAPAGSDLTFKVGPNGSKRPKRLASKRYTISDRNHNAKIVHRTKVARKQDPLAEDREVTTSESDDEACRDTPSPRLEDEVTYSYDSNGPASGGQILEMALTKAVEKFEDKQTTKLVKDEYEILDINDNGDEYAGGAIVADEDDDFELV